MPKKYSFSIPVGDWSGDGHNACDYYHATAAKPFKDVCLAFKAAKEKLDGFSPEQVCSEYEEREVTEEHVELLAKHGYKVPEDFWSRDMAELVVWFLNQGDPDLKATLLPRSKEPPMLRGWDYHKVTGEHLDSFGYGLLGN